MQRLFWALASSSGGHIVLPLDVLPATALLNLASAFHTGGRGFNSRLPSIPFNI